MRGTDSDGEDPGSEPHVEQGPPVVPFAQSAQLLSGIARMLTNGIGDLSSRCLLLRLSAVRCRLIPLSRTR